MPKQSKTTLKGSKKNIDFKRNLRQNLTTSENKIWLELKNKNFENLKFRRQHGIGPFIVDFYCPERKLVIEIDGDVHAADDQINKDEEREQYLKELGLQVIRYFNDDVINNIEGVMQNLYDQVIQGSTSPNPSLQRRGIWVTAILLAAGESKRYGSDKLATLYKGIPLIEKSLSILNACPLIQDIIVVTNPDTPRSISTPKTRIITNPDYKQGMASSLKTGLRATSPDTDAYLVALADMPKINTDLINALIGFFEGTEQKIAVPIYNKQYGHPVIIDASLKDLLFQIEGDKGAREIIKNHPDWVAQMETDDPGVTFDIDHE